MTKHDRTGGARPLARRTLRWLAAAAIALLGATQTRADWLFQSSDANYNWVPTIASSDGDWVFEVEELEYNQIRVVTCLFTKQSTGELDFGAPIGDGGSTIYEIVSIGDTGEQSSIFSGSFSPDKVSKLTFPSTLTHIYGNAFYDAFIEGDLSIPNSVTYIGEYAFSGTRFESIEIHAGVAFIGEGAFGRSYGSQLRPVTFMGDYPSSYCGNIYYTSWPNMTHTYIQLANLQNWLDSGQVSDWDPATGTGEFCYFPLTCLDYVPLSPPSAWYWDDVSSPGTPMITNALGWKFSVTVIDTDGGIGQLRVDACVDFPLSSATLDFSGSIVDVGTGIPYEIVSIGDETLQSQLFGGSDSIAKLILPDTVTNIASQAFANAYAHGDLVIPDSVTYIGEFAFYMNSFTSVEIPASVTRIEDDAFGWVLDSVTFTFLGDYPSSGVGDIYGGSWGGTVHTYIQFAHLQNWLDSGQVSNWDPATGTGEFRNFPLTCLDYVPPSPSDSDWHFTVTVPGNSTDCAVTNAAGWVFRAWFDYLPDGGPVCVRIYQCIEAPAVPGVLDFSGARIDDDTGGTFLFEQFGDGLTSIFYNGTSYEDDKVTGLVLPDQDPVTEPYKIGNGAFANCQYITGDLAIPDAVITIADGAFGNCPFGGTLSFGTSASALTLVEGNAFGSCTFEGVSSWGSLDTIFDWMFAGTTFTTNTFVIPAQITAIGESAFESTIFGADVIVGDGVTDFGDHAFAYSWFQRMSLPSTDVSFGFRTFAWTDMYGDDPEFYYRGAFPDVTDNLLYNSEPTYRTAVSYVTGEWVEDWNAHDIDTYLNGVNTHNGNIQSGNARWLSRAIYCGEWDVSAYLGGGDTPGESETWVHVDVIRVSAGGDVDLEWAFADVETRLGTTTGYRYVIEVCTDLTLMDWVSCVSADLTRLGGMERHRLTNGAMPGSDHRFFKVKAVKN